MGFVLTFLTSLCHGGNKTKAKEELPRPDIVKIEDIDIVTETGPEPEPEIIIVDDPSHPSHVTVMPKLQPIYEHEVDHGQLSPTMRWICETQRFTMRSPSTSRSTSTSTSTTTTPRVNL
jgi:hypothetical protein